MQFVLGPLSAIRKSSSRSVDYVLRQKKKEISHRQQGPLSVFLSRRGLNLNHIKLAQVGRMAGSINSQRL